MTSALWRIATQVEAGAIHLIRCRHGLSPASFYKFKFKYGGMNVSETRCPKSLEDENAKLRRLLAGTKLDNVVLRIFWERADGAECAKNC
jgi:putative transposase